jgi:hypothetical protein
VDFFEILKTLFQQLAALANIILAFIKALLKVLVVILEIIINVISRGISSL